LTVQSKEKMAAALLEGEMNLQWKPRLEEHQEQ